MYAVDKGNFSLLVDNFAALTAEEASDLQVLATEFPYSQIVRSLAARGAQDFQLADRNDVLHRSAIYATDRAALKWVMTSPRTARIVPPPIADIAEPEPQAESSTAVPSYDQVIKDLAALQESKRIYEETIARLENLPHAPLNIAKPEKIEKPEKVVKAEKVEKVEKPKEEKPAEEKPEKKTVTVTGEALIEEIKSTKKKVKPEGDKQKEQQEIIDQFIKTQPMISRPQPAVKPAETEDLAESNTQFNESIVTETLVEILLKQGKKDKAIETLKKLIWKFPQKKAYFAAQIEDLRK